MCKRAEDYFYVALFLSKRLYGSYPQIEGNQLDVFRLLTGGLVEDFKTSKAEKDDSKAKKVNSKVKKDDDNFLPPDKLFERVQMTLNSGSTVLTCISEVCINRLSNVTD